MKRAYNPARTQATAADTQSVARPGTGVAPAAFQGELARQATNAPCVAQLQALQTSADASAPTARLARLDASSSLSSTVAQASFAGGHGGSLTIEHAGSSEIVTDTITATPFGEQPAPDKRASTAPKSAFIWNVPTHGRAEQVAKRYAEPWGSEEDARKRQRLVIGVNTRQSVFESPADAKQRAEDNAKVADANGAIGMAVSFVWRPKLKCNTAKAQGADFVWSNRALSGRTEEAAKTERAEALEKVPYGEIRTTILSHASTAKYAGDFQAADYEPYVHISDPDTPSFKVPKGNAQPDKIDDKHPLGGAFSEESSTLLFDRLTELIERRTEKRQDHPAKPMPSVLAGGYQLRPSSSGSEGAALPLSGIASQIDMQARRILFSKGRSPVAAYVPEPNLAVRWADLPKSATSPAALDAGRLFGSGTGESPTLIKNIIEKLKLEGKDAEALRKAVAFKPSAAIATGATGVGKGGERFRVASERTPEPKAPVASPTTLPEAFAEILSSGQQHANPNTWFGKAVNSVTNETGLQISKNGRSRLFKHLRFHTKAALDKHGMATNVPGFSQDPRENLPDRFVGDERTAATRLVEIAEDTIAMLEAYVPAIQKIIAPPSTPAKDE